MRPIETTYRSVTFRSRLEARWAVFFDELDIKWRYECCTYDLPKLGQYTPDFVLGQDQCFAEVKPVELTLLEVAKCRAVSMAGDAWCVMLVGTPDFAHYWQVNKADEKLVFVWADGELCVPAPMDVAASEHQFSARYYAAVERAKRARFDGYDGDRETIKARYR